MNKLTEIEKQYAAAVVRDMKALNINDPKLWPMIRGSMKRVAYHEGGHFAARCFTMLELSHVTEISIIGNENNAGYVRSERNFTEQGLESYPPPLQRSNGYMLLLKDLAGYGAEMILDKSEEWGSIFEYYDSMYGDDWYGEREEGTDFYTAEQIAKIMSKPFMRDYRTLNLASKWTLEMLRIPAVWNIVATVADKLIKRGEINGNACEKLLNMAWDSEFPSIHNLPKWKRRIFPKPGELEKYIERA